jgi:outer membrane PBP1 activator LpoA protein
VPAPATEAASEPARAAETAPLPISAPAPARDPVPLALVLPLESPLYGRAADAVKAGFAAAAAAANIHYDVIAHGDGGVVAAFAKAREGGARVVVGPLVRDDLKAIAVAGGDLPWTIALNQLDEGSALPARVYTLALVVESEGVQLARSAQADGARSVVIIGGDNPLQKRFAGAFAGEWILLGGAAPVTFRFDRAPDMLALLRREFAKVAPDAVVLAVDAQDAALAKPYLGHVLTYTSSQINDRQSRESLRDLDAVRFVELPWLADPSGAAFSRVARPDYGNAALDRLYALGVDAFHVAQAFADGAPTTLEFDGVTGHLALDRSRQFVREGTLLQFRDGEIVPAGR